MASIAAVTHSVSRDDVAHHFGGDTFANLLEQTLGTDGSLEGAVLRGTVVGIRGDFVIIDVGLKSEGHVALREFSSAPEGVPNAGDEVDVYVERYEDRNGEMSLSREKARREEIWVTLERSFVSAERVNGTIFGKVKGGLTVDLSGVVAFLPNSQVDVRPIKDVTALMNVVQPFQILKLDRKRGNIVVSRRSILEESRADARADFVANLSEGQIIEGTVKNLTDYGAFVDLGGVDGLLHVTDISWKRINHPSEALTIGQKVTVQVIRFNAETKRISLGMKQLATDPWEGIAERVPVGTDITGKVSNIADYGVFVDLGGGLEGLAHITELSWTKKNIHPSKILTIGQEVNVRVLEIDNEKRRISLGLKQTQENPWSLITAQYPAGTVLDGEVKAVTDVGIFVSLGGDVDALLPTSELGGVKADSFNKGDTIKARVIEADAEKEKFVLSLRALQGDQFMEAVGTTKKGDVVTCTVKSIETGGINVTFGDGLTGFIKRGDLSRDRSEQRADRFAVGEKVDAQIISIDAGSRKVTLSVKSRELAEEKQAMKEFGSADSGASLGDILGPVMKQAAKPAKTTKK